MHFKMRQNHMIDFLFPVALFFVFTLSALTVLLLATNIYRSTVEDSTLNDSARTSLAYIAEKVHQNDDVDAVQLGTFDGCQALILKQSYNKEEYYTYIYKDGDELKEIFLKEGAKAKASGGTAILKVNDFSMSPIANDLIRFECEDNQGERASVVVGTRTENTLK